MLFVTSPSPSSNGSKQDLRHAAYPTHPRIRFNGPPGLGRPTPLGPCRFLARKHPSEGPTWLDPLESYVCNIHPRTRDDGDFLPPPESQGPSEEVLVHAAQSKVLHNMQETAAVGAAW